MNTKRNLKIVLALCSIFAAGGVIGGLLTKQFLRREPPRGMAFENWSQKMMHLLQAKLGLTSEQQPKVKAILEETEKEFNARHCQEAIEHGQILERAQKRLDQELTPEQQKIHAQLIKDFRARTKDRIRREPPKHSP